MRLLILSDIHANLTALDAVLDDAERMFAPDAVALLGDYVDYGMRPNEAIERIRSIQLPVVCALWGNHEDAIMREDWGRFSSPRGSQSAQFTRGLLSQSSLDWISGLEGRTGSQEFELCEKRFLAVHGSMVDAYWKAVNSADQLDEQDYSGYDFVLSGHNHVPHFFARFYPCDNPVMRNKKKTTFINPGSVGQPRNHDPRAHYAIWDSESGVTLRAVSYNIQVEQELYDGSIDEFYRTRLLVGV